MNKGERIRIVSGRTGKDATGTVFWTGPNKYGEGLRLGVSGDDGETYWVAEEHVEKLAATDAGFKREVASENFEKGDRVSYKKGGQSGVGTIIWTGQSKSGPGMRVGVRDDNLEEAVWLDGHLVSKLDPADEPAPGTQDGADAWGGGGRQDGGGRGGGAPRGGNSGSGYDGGGWGDEAEDDGYLGGGQADLSAPPPMDGPPIGDGVYDDLAAGADEDETPF